jgi:hypothetical protein
MKAEELRTKLFQLRAQTAEIERELSLRKEVEAESQRHVAAVLKLQAANRTLAEQKAYDAEIRRGQILFANVVPENHPDDWRTQENPNMEIYRQQYPHPSGRIPKKHSSRFSCLSTYIVWRSTPSQWVEKPGQEPMEFRELPANVFGTFFWDNQTSPPPYHGYNPKAPKGYGKAETIPPSFSSSFPKDKWRLSHLERTRPVPMVSGRSKGGMNSKVGTQTYPRLPWSCGRPART